MIKIFLVTLLLCCAQTYAQSPNYNISFPSPNAASLGIFGEVPVSLHSGLPNISVPIYELKEGPIKVPIALNYHASGVRPDMHPGWVGNNWSLSCGGMITRVIKSFPDETIYFVDNNIFITNGHIPQQYNVGHFYNNFIQNSNWATANRIDTLARKGTEYAYGKTTDYFRETEPDEFIFNFNGNTGKFIFDENKNIRCISHPEIKVEIDSILVTTAYNTRNLIIQPGDTIPFAYYQHDMINSPGTGVFADGVVGLADFKIRGFRITMPDGIQYEFGWWNQPDDYNNFPFEFSVNFFQQVYASESWDTWYLKRIKSPDGHIVDFEYSWSPDGIYSPIVSFGSTVAVEKANGSATPKGLLGIFGPVKASSSSILQYYTGRVIRPTYVTKITSSTEQIDFTTGLTKELKYNYGDIINYYYNQHVNSFDNSLDPGSYEFGYLPIRDSVYGLFIDFGLARWRQLNSLVVRNKETQKSMKSWNFNYTSDSTKRLTLLSLEQKGNSSDSSLKYTFTYNNSKTLPAYNSYQTDHWGFYNGKTPNLGTFSDNDLNNFYSYKECDTAFLKAGILEKITYPTGGYTQFAYEPNQFSKIVKRDTITGTFSVQSVSARYGGGLRIKKITHYSGNGGPEIIKNYEYTDGILSGDFQYFWKGYRGRLANGNNYTADRFVSQTMLPVSTNSVGSYVGYSKVKEFTAGNGYTEYHYTNYDKLDDNFLASIDPQKSRFSPFSDRSIERGLLVKQFDYSQGNMLLREQYITYPLADTSKYSRATNAKNFTVLQGLAVEGSSYKIYTYPYKEKQIKMVIHDQADSAKKMTTTTDFEYENLYSLLQWEKSINSKGDTLKTNYKYPFNFTGTPAYDSMKNRNVLSPVVEQLKYKNSTFLQSAKTNYQTWPAFFQAPSTVETKVGSANYEVRQKIIKYDNSGNVISLQKADDAKISYVWDYNNVYPVAECTNASDAAIAYTSFEADGKGGWTFNGVPSTVLAATGNKAYYLNGTNNITKTGLSDKQVYIVSYYTFNPSPLTITGTNSGFPVKGKTISGWTYYEHRISGVTSVAISNARAYIDELRLYPVDAQMKTFTYKLPIGISSACDVNGRITKYTYDGFGRLILVMDDDSNFVKKICYNYNGQTENCGLVSGDRVIAQTFFRSNCTNDSIGSQVTVSVDASQFFAPSVEEANDLATSYLKLIGQRRADSIGQCIPNPLGLRFSGENMTNEHLVQIDGHQLRNSDFLYPKSDAGLPPRNKFGTRHSHFSGNAISN